MGLYQKKYFCYTAGCTAVKVTTDYAFIYVLVGPKTCHTFFFATSLPIYKNQCDALYYLQSPLAFSALHYLLVSNPLPPDGMTQKL